MRFQHLNVEFELPDEWWQEAGMQTFVAPNRTYITSTHKASILEVPIEDLAPVLRKGSHGVFNDSPEFGSAHERVVCILRGFIEDVPLPPVEVARLASISPPRYKLIHGAHRPYCSIAAGYSHIPAVEVDDFFGTNLGA